MNEIISSKTWIILLRYSIIKLNNINLNIYNRLTIFKSFVYSDI